MKSINAYLSFNGTAREAMTFYQGCLGGELSFLTIGESPIADQMPPESADTILHSSLTTPEFVLMGSDMGGADLVPGNSIGLLLNCCSEAEVHEKFEKLSAGGQSVMPPAEQFWGDIFGHLVDKYGHTWMVTYAKTLA